MPRYLIAFRMSAGTATSPPTRLTDDVRSDEFARADLGTVSLCFRRKPGDARFRFRPKPTDVGLVGERESAGLPSAQRPGGRGPRIGTTSAVFPVSTAVISAPTRSVTSRNGSTNRCVYRAVVLA